MELAVAFVENRVWLAGRVELGGLASSQALEANRTLPEGAMIISAVVPSTRTFSDHMGA